MNYNQSFGSQTIPKSYIDRLNPEFVESVEKDGAKGDFISLISRGTKDYEMVDRFEKYWKINNGQAQRMENSTTEEVEVKFKFRKMELLDGSSANGFKGGQFPSKEQSVFDRNDVIIHWRPLLLLSKKTLKIRN